MKEDEDTANNQDPSSKKLSTMSSSNERKRRLTTKLLSQQENLKERQKKFASQRMDRMLSLTSQHQHIIEMAALYLNVTPEELIEGVIDDDNHIELLVSFCSEGGRCGLFVYYQEGDLPSIETGRWNSETQGGNKIKKCIITDGSVEMIDTAVIVYRTKSNINIDMKNIGEELQFATVDFEYDKSTVMTIAWQMMDRLCRPYLNITKDWGDLKKTAQGCAMQKNFVADFTSFFNFVYTTKLDLECGVKFVINAEFYSEHLSSGVSAVKASATKPEVVREVENYVRIWIKQMEMALIQLSQLRKEDDKVGPLTELEYWRRQLTKFESIMEHLKSIECQMHIHLLLLAKSKYLKRWKKIDNAVTDACNEAKDNVKYLYTLEKFCEPLYRCDPNSMGQTLPSLLYAIRMIYTTSRFFNTTERISALFVKMTNQMVNVCKRYLTDNGVLTLWEQQKKTVLQKIEVCLNLYTRYYYSYLKLRNDMHEAGEPEFDCSEMYVFGKFEAFKIRTEQI